MKDTIIAAAKFHELAAAATRNGGFFVSAGGETAAIIASEIARATNTTLTAAMEALELTSWCVWGPDWYFKMGINQPFDGLDNYRWDARELARAACRATKRQ